MQRLGYLPKGTPPGGRAGPGILALWRSWAWHPGTVGPVTRHTVGWPPCCLPTLHTGTQRTLEFCKSHVRLEEMCVYTAVCFILTLL